MLRRIFISYLLLTLIPVCLPLPNRKANRIPSTAQFSAVSIAELQKKAEGGEGDSQAALGRAYADGNGVPQDDNLAVTWHRKAAEQEKAEAENDLKNGAKQAAKWRQQHRANRPSQSPSPMAPGNPPVACR